MFNETVNIVELDEGLDGETFFLYVFLAAVVVLIIVGAQQFFVSFGVSLETQCIRYAINWLLIGFAEEAHEFIQTEDGNGNV